MKKLIALLFASSLVACTSTSSTPNPVQLVPSPTQAISPSATAPAPALGPDVTHYRADPQRTGAYDFIAIHAMPEIKWQKLMTSSASLGSPVYADGVLYVSSQNGRLYAFDTENGEELWSAVVGRLPASIAIAGDFIFVNDLNNTTNAFLRENGEKVWSVPIEGSGWGAPVVVEATVFVVSERGVYALDARSGKTIWELETGTHQGFVGSPSYAEGVLCFGVGGTFYALEASSGKELWKHEGDTWFYGSAIFDSSVYTGNDDGHFHAYDLQTGEERWHSDLKGAGWSAPAIANGIVYVGNVDQHLYAFHAQTGEEIWSFEAVDWASSDPVVSDGVVYFGVGNHDNREGPRPLYALDTQTGQELWQFEAESRLMTAPALSEGAIYIVSIKGMIYALR